MLPHARNDTENQRRRLDSLSTYPGRLQQPPHWLPSACPSGLPSILCLISPSHQLHSMCSLLDRLWDGLTTLRLYVLFLFTCKFLQSTVQMPLPPALPDSLILSLGLHSIFYKHTVLTKCFLLSCSVSAELLLGRPIHQSSLCLQPSLQGLAWHAVGLC